MQIHNNYIDQLINLSLISLKLQTYATYKLYQTMLNIPFTQN